MSRFSAHAIKRFVERYIEPMPNRPRLLERELREFQLQARQPAFRWDGSRFRVIGSLVGQNYSQARLVHREEAESLIAGRLRPRPDRYYRSAGPGAGVWVVRWADQRGERVLTFLMSGRDDEDVREEST